LHSRFYLNNCKWEKYAWLLMKIPLLFFTIWEYGAADHSPNLGLAVWQCATVTHDLLDCAWAVTHSW
jgi:hypothetical protein